MTDKPMKLAKDLVAGDRIMVTAKNRNRQDEVTVLAVVPSVQTIRRNVLLVTLRTADGTDLHRTMEEFRTVRLAT
jgi:hypothetical protein